MQDTGLKSDAVPDHQGNLAPRPFLFFAQPSPEIGMVKSAESTVRHGGGPKSIMYRLIMAVAVGGAILVAMGTIAWFISDRSDAGSVRWLSYLLAPAGVIIVLFLTRFRATCSYVGVEGVERARVKRSLSAPPTIDRLIFSAASELHAAQTRHFVNGVYTGTTYDYSWNDQEGNRLLRLKGKYQGKKKPPKAGDRFHFGSAAEIAWSIHFLKRAEEHLKTAGSIPFRVDKKRWIRVGPGFLEFHFGGDPVRVTREEIAKVTLGSGRFAFKHKDAKWFSSEGKYNFRYGAMANARVFLMALDRLMGYRWN